MENSTKDRILDEALLMFAENGYKGTNLRELASQLGLSKSALYKHYSSKEDIWNSLLDRMEEYYAQRFGSEKNLPPQPKSCEELFLLTMYMLRFTVNDPKIILTRKLLLTEQFHDERVKKLAAKHFLEGTQKIFERIFEQMMADGLMKKEDPVMLSFIYTAPITALVHHCDRDPENQEQIFKRIENFINHFILTYSMNANY